MIPNGQAIQHPPSISGQRLPNQIRISFVKRNLPESDSPFQLLPAFVRNNTLMNVKCSLCEEVHRNSEMQSVSRCKHLFCSPCLLRYAIYKINVMEDVRCPEEGCPELLQQNSSVFEHLPPDSKQKFSRNSVWKQTISNPNLKLCPKESCQGMIDKSQITHECNRCRTQYCKQCQLVKHEGTCDCNFQRAFKGWKRCPSCKVFIQRTQGCNHMTCRCSHQFCYVCLAYWEASHYNCGTREYLRDLQIGRERQIAQMGCCGRFFAGLLCIVMIPIFIAAFVALWAISLVVAAIVGLCFMPYFVWQSLRIHHHDCASILCLLILVPLGPVVAVGGTLYFGLMFLVFGIGTILGIFKLFWCTCGPTGQEQQFGVYEQPDPR